MLHLSTAALLLAFGLSSLSDVPPRWKPTDSTSDLFTDMSRTFR